MHFTKRENNDTTRPRPGRSAGGSFFHRNGTPKKNLRPDIQSPRPAQRRNIFYPKKTAHTARQG
ncbi:MAG: hypothetical protein D6714_15565 [Bacteroidetes bacterium]|nr:MAG: hypothetical protein D6714_15565 [Bacteroidota bacterium]